MTHRLAAVLVAAAMVVGVGAGLTAAELGWFGPASARADAVSWPKVGPGWFLGAVVHLPAKGRWTTTLDLIAPTGAVRTVATVRGSMDPVAWSGDGRRALVSGPLSKGTDPVTEVVDLTKGTASPFVMTQLHGNGTPIGFTRPDGLEVLTQVDMTTTVVLQRRALGGGDPVTLATGVISGANVVSTPDGQAVYVGEHSGIKLVSNLGTGPIAQVPSSAGCTPVRLWSRSELLAHCGGISAPIGRGYLEVLPLRGGRPRLIAKDVAQPPMININAFPIGNEIYTATSGGCGAGPIGRIGPGGTFYPISSTTEPPVYDVLTSNGKELAAGATDYGCEGGGRISLVWLNPLTFQSRTLFSVVGKPAYFVPFSTYNGLG